MCSLPKSMQEIVLATLLTGCTSFNPPACPTPPAFVHPPLPEEPMMCPKIQYIYIDYQGSRFAAIPIDVARDKLICEKDIVRYIGDQNNLINYYRDNVK